MIPKQEDQHTEFKTSFSDEVIIALVAFANAKGGTAYIGVNDDGTVAANHYRSQPRNKQIADVFKDLGEIEKYGSGIGRVIRAFHEAGHPTPVWQQISDGIMVTAYPRNDSEFPQKGNNNDGVKDGIRQKLGKNERSALELLVKDPKLTAKRLSIALNINIRNAEKALASLKRKGYIIRVGSPKKGFWSVIKTIEPDGINDGINDGVKSDGIKKNDGVDNDGIKQDLAEN